MDEVGDIRQGATGDDLTVGGRDGGGRSNGVRGAAGGGRRPGGRHWSGRGRRPGGGRGRGRTGRRERRGRRERGRRRGRRERGRGRCGRVEVYSGEEHVDAGYDSGAAVQRCATTVDFQASRTDADGVEVSSQLLVQLQGEGAREWVAMLTAHPAVAPQTAAIYRAPRRHHEEEGETTRNTGDFTGKVEDGSEKGCVEFRSVVQCGVD
jgi:hypothetical protein